MDKRKFAKRLMLHYMTMLAKATGIETDNDFRAEINDIVDCMIDAAKEEIRSEQHG